MGNPIPVEIKLKKTPSVKAVCFAMLGYLLLIYDSKCTIIAT